MVARAVEGAAIPVTLPNDRLATLGKVLAPADAVVGMIALLWEGQRDRHAGGPISQPVTQEAAQTAVHLAVTLVQWFSAGAIYRP